MNSIEQLLMSAQQYYKQTEYYKCQQILLSLALNYTINAEQYILLALTYLKLKQYKQAIKILLYIMNNKLTSQLQQNEAVGLLAQAYIEQQQYFEAYQLINQYQINDQDLVQFIDIYYKIYCYQLTNKDYQLIQSKDKSHWKQLKMNLFQYNKENYINESSQQMKYIVDVFKKQENLQYYINYLLYVVDKQTIISLLHNISVFYISNKDYDQARKYNDECLNLLDNQDQLTTNNIEIFFTKAIINNDYKLALQLISKTYPLKIHDSYRNHLDSMTIDLLRKNGQKYEYILLKSNSIQKEAEHMSLKNFALCLDTIIENKIYTDKQFIDSLNKQQYQLLRFYYYSKKLEKEKINDKTTEDLFKLFQKCTTINKQNKILINIIVKILQCLYDQNQLTQKQIDVLNRLKNIDQ